jgi:hypothetical protein
MNRAIAAVYAITIGSGGEPYTEEEKTKLVQAIPALIDEISRLDAIARDPFVRGYIERFGLGKSDVSK